MKNFTKILSELNEGEAVATRTNTVMYKAKQKEIVIQPPFGSEMLPTKLGMDIYGDLKDEKRFNQYHNIIKDTNNECNKVFVDMEKKLKKIMDKAVVKMKKV